MTFKVKPYFMKKVSRYIILAFIQKYLSKKNGFLSIKITFFELQ